MSLLDQIFIKVPPIKMIAQERNNDVGKWSVGKKKRVQYRTATQNVISTGETEISMLVKTKKSAGGTSNRCKEAQSSKVREGTDERIPSKKFFA